MQETKQESFKAKYDRDGYALMRGSFQPAEVAHVLAAAQADQKIAEKTVGRGDKDGLETKLALYYNLDDSIFSTLARESRIVEPLEELLGEAAAHYHTKIMQKEPRVGGAWEWHQDYGYWYHDGFLFPRMISALTAFTPSTKENGCLQVMVGSHKMGRIYHSRSGEQQGADMEHVEQALARMDNVYMEMEPGDVLYFDSLLLHRSDSNRSENPRWSMITAYNGVSNPPYKDINPNFSIPINKLRNEDLSKVEVKGLSESADFLKR